MESRPNIWQFQSQRDIDRLVSALSYPDAEIRRRAVMALRSLDAARSVPALRAALLRETDMQVRVSLQVAIQAMDTRTDIAALARARDTQGLIHLLNGQNIDYAIGAAHALGELGDRTAVEPLIIQFNNAASQPALRLAAAEALLALKSAPAVVTLLGALRRDNWQVRRNAAAVLGQIQATWAVLPLAAALDDPNPVVRRTAAAALRRIGTADALTVLQKRFGGKSPDTVALTGPVTNPVMFQSKKESPASSVTNAAAANMPHPTLDTPPFGMPRLVLHPEPEPDQAVPKATLVAHVISTPDPAPSIQERSAATIVAAEPPPSADLVPSPLAAVEPAVQEAKVLANTDAEVRPAARTETDLNPKPGKPEESPTGTPPPPQPMLLARPVHKLIAFLRNRD